MAHTLNEQSLIITGADADERYENLLTGIASLTGWTVENDKAYCDSGKTLGIGFEHTAGATTCRVEGFHGQTTMEYTGNYPLSSDFTIYFHRSADENVEFLDLNAVYCQFLHTINANDDDMFFMPKTASDLYFATTATAGSEVYSLTYNTALTYCITKIPDIQNGITIPSLYMAISVANPVRRNQLVTFNGNVYRLAFFGTSNSGITCAALAFQVEESA